MRFLWGLIIFRVGQNTYVAIDRDRMLGYIVRIMRSMFTNAGRGIQGRLLYRSNVNIVGNLHVFKDSLNFLGGLKSGKKDSAQ